MEVAVEVAVAVADAIADTARSRPTVSASNDTVLPSVALHVASTIHPFPDPTHVSPPFQYAVHELFPTHADVSRLTPFVHDPDTGHVVEDAQM